MSYLKDIEAIESVGKRIKQLREEQNLSQEQLAFESGVIRSQITRIENGKINTSISTLFAISRALNVHPRELFDVEFKLDL